MDSSNQNIARIIRRVLLDLDPAAGTRLGYRGPRRDMRPALPYNTACLFWSLVACDGVRRRFCLVFINVT